MTIFGDEKFVISHCIAFVSSVCVYRQCLCLYLSEYILVQSLLMFLGMTALHCYEKKIFLEYLVCHLGNE